MRTKPHRGALLERLLDGDRAVAELIFACGLIIGLAVTAAISGLIGLL